MDDYLAGLSTEGINEDTRNIDLCSTEEMVAMINRQDALVAGAVAAEQQHIARAAGRAGRLGMSAHLRRLSGNGAGLYRRRGYRSALPSRGL